MKFFKKIWLHVGIAIDVFYYVLFIYFLSCSVLRNCWEDYVADIGTNISEEKQNSEMFKLPSSSRQATVNWVVVN